MSLGFTKIPFLNRINSSLYIGIYYVRFFWAHQHIDCQSCQPTTGLLTICQQIEVNDYADSLEVVFALRAGLAYLRGDCKPYPHNVKGRL